MQTLDLTTLYIESLKRDNKWKMAFTRGLLPDWNWSLRANELGPAFSGPYEIGMSMRNRLFNEALAELDKAEEERKGDRPLIFSRDIVYSAQTKRAVRTIKDLEGARCIEHVILIGRTLGIAN